MRTFFFLNKQLWSGVSVLRAYLNLRLSREVLRGYVVDIGGGEGAEYINFMSKAEDVRFVTFDVKHGDVIDFECDILPMHDGTCDTVLFLNVMEHVYNHKHILGEVYRIRKQGGKLIGFVPFLMWPHPDPKDFFRYTDEALSGIFADVLPPDNRGTIEPIAAQGGFTAAWHMVNHMFPRPFRVLFFSICYFIDMLIAIIKPEVRKRYVLGYYFVI